MRVTDDRVLVGVDNAASLSDERVRKLLSSFDDLVFELDDEGAYVGIWTADDSLLAAPRSALLGRTMREALGEEAGHEVSRAIALAIETGRPQLCEYQLDVPAGTRSFQGRVAIIGGPSATQRVCLVVRDVTELRAASEDVSRHLKRLELVHVVDRAVLDRCALPELAAIILRRVREMTEQTAPRSSCSIRPRGRRASWGSIRRRHRSCSSWSS